MGYRCDRCVASSDSKHSLAAWVWNSNSCHWQGHLQPWMHRLASLRVSFPGCSPTTTEVQQHSCHAQPRLRDVIWFREREHVGRVGLLLQLIVVDRRWHKCTMLNQGSVVLDLEQKSLFGSGGRSLFGSGPASTTRHVGHTCHDEARHNPRDPCNYSTARPVYKGTSNSATNLDRPVG